MISVGWIIINDDGSTYRPNKSPGEWYWRREPSRIYQTQKRAEAYADGKRVAEVFIKEI